MANATKMASNSFMISRCH